MARDRDRALYCKGLIVDKVIKKAREYWQIRSAGDCGEARTVAHNELMDEMKRAGIRFDDREHAAIIARAMIVLDDAGFHMEVSR